MNKKQGQFIIRTLCQQSTGMKSIRSIYTVSNCELKYEKNATKGQMFGRPSSEQIKVYFN